MTSSTTEFFEGLRERGHEPMLAKISGSVRFDVTNGKRTERWLVSVDKGDIAVSHKNAAADCVVQGPRDVFDRITSGQMNAMAAILRGAVSLQGDTILAVLFQRLLPAP